MTDKKLRELDAFIAEHVMGFEYPCLFEPTGATGEICARCNHHISFDRHDFFRYTTDPAAAMIVLEKCLMRTDMGDPSFCSLDGTNYWVRTARRNQHIE